MDIKLYDHQIEALSKMKNGCILNGGVGSGKSITSLAYYFTQYGGELNPYKKMKNPPDLYIITTARKRDTLEWDQELIPFLLSTDSSVSAYDNKVIIDSWNNLPKYVGVKNSFFIFDEQRLVGKGAWVRTFLKIVLNNKWILLSATPGDQWSDYIPVFIANGFYRNRTQFNNEHVVYKPHTNWPQIERYINTGKLNYYRNLILVNMDFKRSTIEHHEDIIVNYNRGEYKLLMKERFDYINNKPIESGAKLGYLLRKASNSHPDRLEKVLEIVRLRKKVIIFYNFDYELEMLRDLPYFLATGHHVDLAEWNGQKHEPVPTSDSWVYLVQYSAGNEGWNCTSTDTIIFFSQSYSYKATKQAAGRINRLNTSYVDLYYYHLKSKSGIDVAISRALSNKKDFNERSYFKKGQ